MPHLLVQLTREVLSAVKRNTLVLTAVLFIFATFAWAGWANFEYRKQAAERLQASAAKGELVADAAGGAAEYVSPLMGKAAPEFELEDLSGNKVSLASYKGKAVLVNFWATWCVPCKLEMPWFVDLHKQYASQGFEILGVNEDETKDRAQIGKFTKKIGVNYPILLGNDASSKAYGGIELLPTSFYVGRDGIVVEEAAGLISRDEIEANIKKALAAGN
jgi:cytochrome c biogenesis protein CcmG/thiol:disulfide interchange protein DsbE